MMNQFVESLEPRQFLSTVAVNLNSTAQTIRGIGGSMAKNARFPGAPLSDPVMTYNLANLPTPVVRVAIPLEGWEPVPDNNDANKVNWAGFKDTGQMHQQFLQLQDFKKRGMTLMASVFDVPNWMV